MTARSPTIPLHGKLSVFATEFSTMTPAPVPRTSRKIFGPLPSILLKKPSRRFSVVLMEMLSKAYRPSTYNFRSWIKL
jgi:hypothetical protein